MKYLFLTVTLLSSLNLMANTNKCTNPPSPGINEFPGCHGAYVAVINARIFTNPIGSILNPQSFSKADDLIVQAHAGHGCDLEAEVVKIHRKCKQVDTNVLAHVIVEIDEAKGFCTIKKSEGPNGKKITSINVDNITSFRNKYIKVLQDRNECRK